MSCHRPFGFSRSEDGEMVMGTSRLGARLQAAVSGSEYLECACRTCEGCRARRARDWAIRGTHELATTTWNREYVYTNRKGELAKKVLPALPVPTGCFVTLTYREEDRPFNLVHEDFQRFVRAVRRRFGEVRFLMCGEYGSKAGREHFHACLFGVDFRKDRYPWRRKGERLYFRSDRLEECWPHGNSELADLNYATVSYTAGYVLKKLKRSDWHLEHAVYGEDSEPIFVPKEEYVGMSKKPGLGFFWIEKYWRRVYANDEVHVGGKTFRPPRYYDEWLQEQHPYVWEEVLERRIKEASENGMTSQATCDARRTIHERKLELTPHRGSLHR